jgi:undecaprenyl-diphosphatase
MPDSLFQSAILGVIQGLSEFLPISSTAHLIIVPYFFHWKDPGLGFDVALHFGTLIAILAFFWKDWLNIFELAFRNEAQNSKLPSGAGFCQGDSKTQNYGKNILWVLVFATIPGILAGVFLEKKAETIFRHPIIIAISLALVGVLLYLADHYSKKNLLIQNIGWKKAIIIGLAQAFAIIPGMSRSGSTISAGLFLGLNRKDAAHFSFLLSTPIIFGATIIKFPEMIHDGVDLSILVGVIFSAVSGYLAINYLLRFIEKIGYFPFFIYRLLLALSIIIFHISTVR